MAARRSKPGVQMQEAVILLGFSLSHTEGFFSVVRGTLFPQAIVLMLSGSQRVRFSNRSGRFFLQLPSLPTTAAKQVFLLLETLF